ncbi:hypothetical protein ElyMa_001308500 [Elysia marginata]|uniref:Uncharacterized protein n=1 Tax=Elysia marginata TaxID=1093978 RepID=A0AAV4IMW4_9GAST|nr:hypothetical protein ElyMa_001308500 [Elysia marginata]
MLILNGIPGKFFSRGRAGVPGIVCVSGEQAATAPAFLEKISNIIARFSSGARPAIWPELRTGTEVKGHAIWIILTSRMRL